MSGNTIGTLGAVSGSNGIVTTQINMPGDPDQYFKLIVEAFWLSKDDLSDTELLLSIEHLATISRSKHTYYQMHNYDFNDLDTSEDNNNRIISEFFDKFVGFFKNKNIDFSTKVITMNIIKEVFYGYFPNRFQPQSFYDFFDAIINDNFDEYVKNNKYRKDNEKLNYWECSSFIIYNWNNCTYLSEGKNVPLSYYFERLTKKYESSKSIYTTRSIKSLTIKNSTNIIPARYVLSKPFSSFDEVSKSILLLDFALAEGSKTNSERVDRVNKYLSNTESFSEAFFAKHSMIDFARVISSVILIGGKKRANLTLHKWVFEKEENFEWFLNCINDKYYPLLSANACKELEHYIKLPISLCETLIEGFKIDNSKAAKKLIRTITE